MGDEPDESWQRLAAYLDLPIEAVWRMNQVHGCRVLDVDQAPIPDGALPSADAAVSSRDDVALAVKVADCVPMLLADRTGRGVAAIHAGWRGTAQRMATAAVRAMSLAFGCVASDLVAAVGPSIGACCYQVGPEVRDAFMPAALEAGGVSNEASWFAPGGGDRWQLDLWRANADQLEIAGILPSSIHVAGLCTACHLDRFYSFRREGASASRMLAAIRKRPR